MKNDLKHLRRSELIDLIYEMKKREIELQTRLDEAEAVMLVTRGVIRTRMSVRMAWGKPILSKPMEKTFIHCVGVL